MKCSKCGKEIRDDVIFCTNCGTRINKHNSNIITIKLNTLFKCILIVIVLITVCIFLFLRNNKKDKILEIENNISLDVTKNSDNSTSELYNAEDLHPTYLVKFGDIYYYIDNQGYILDVLDTDNTVPIIEGLKTDFKNSENMEKLSDEDITSLNTINSIMEATKDQDIYNVISKIIIEDNEYILFSENQKKYIYLGDATDIKTKITYAKTIMEKEKVSGIIYLNGDLQNGFKPYFREDVNAEDVTDDSLNVEKDEEKNTNSINNEIQLFSQIYEGMSYYEVYALLGNPISTTKNTSMFMTCVWSTKEGVIQIQFMNGNVYQKSIH